LFLADADGKNERPLLPATSRDYNASFSSDGKWIAFSSGRDTKPGRATPSWELLQSTAIYIVRPDGTGLRRLTELGGYSGSPQWSRDGRRIVCYQSTPRGVYPQRFERTGTSQITSIDVETGDVQTHTKGPGVKVSPRYAEGEDISYVVIFGEKQGLQFTSGRSAAGAMRYPSWSPDGKTMIYHKNLNGEVAVTPAFGLDPAFDLCSTRGEMLAYSPNGEQLALTPGSPIKA